MKSPKNTPVISVPKRYKVTQMLAELEDILNKCRVLGDITLTKILYKASLSKIGKFKEICSIRFHMSIGCRLCDYPA